MRQMFLNTLTKKNVFMFSYLLQDFILNVSFVMVTKQQFLPVPFMLFLDSCMILLGGSFLSHCESPWYYKAEYMFLKM